MRISGASQRDRFLAVGAVCAAGAFLLLTASRAIVLRDVLRIDISISLRYELYPAFEVFGALALSIAFGFAAWGLISSGSSRSRRLGVAMVCAAIGSLSAAVAIGLEYWEFVQHHYLHNVGTIGLTWFLAEVAVSLAAVVAAIAFLGEMRNRSGNLSRALLILATGFALYAVTNGLTGVYWDSSSYVTRLVSPSDQFVAGFWVTAGGNLVLAIGAVIAGAAFSGSADRNGRLSLAAIVLALGLLVAVVGGTLALTDNPNIEPSGLAGWLGVAHGAILIITMACAAAGFQRAALSASTARS